MATQPINSLQSVTGKEIPVYNGDYDNSKMEQGDFLKVLLTSFQYQDPFETQDISKFIDNTVKLRELEVMKNFETSVQSLNDNNTLFLNTTNLIDKSVLYKGDETFVHDGKTHVQFVPQKDAPSATLYIYDSDGKIVEKKAFSDVKKGQSYTFDLDDTTIADGYYKVDVVAKEGEKRVPVDLYATAKVEGIEKDGYDIYALFDAQKKIKISDIIKIGG